MAYTANNACSTLDSYLNVAGRADVSKTIIEDTKDRGFILKLPNGEQVVVFTYPLVHKQDDTKNYFDTRDSGPHERAIAWNYALQRHMKYFCLGVNDQVEKYEDYIFSLECNERDIESLSGTEGGDRSTTSTGNQIIIPNNYIPSKPFERITNNLGTFISVIHRDSLYDYLEKYDNRPYLMDKELIDLAMAENEAEKKAKLPDENTRLTTGTNVLLYGVPGSGKSWTIEHEYCKEGTKVERLVFHPDYTYSDFIGQILPAVAEDGQVSYKFTAGPFTEILRDAYGDPTTEYILVIEEINRGNAPAIFGEVFQLLDRKIEKLEKGDDGFPIGTSEYGITNANVAKIVYGDPTHKVRIPSNLSIIGTMNTSDQNVFTLDTAFQRRWEMRLIENNFENVDQKFANAEIWDTGITWEVFCKQINEVIVGNNVRMTSSEDKRLGAYFVRLRDIVKDQDTVKFTKTEYDDLRRKESADAISDDDRKRLADIRETMKKNRRFPEKVIKYLWDDAFKFNREVIFETNEYRSLESVIRAFMYAEGIQRFKMFKQNIVDSLQNPEGEDEE